MSDEQPEIEAAAKAIYESRLLMQPREPWGSHAPSRSVTEKFCIEAARAAVAAYQAAKGEAVRESGNKILDGLDDALAYSAGDETAATLVTVRSPLLPRRV